MFYQRLNIALPKFLVALLVGLLLPPVTGLVSNHFIPSASAGESPSADLATIATYLRGYQADLRNPNFYYYTLDGNAKTISDGGGDMYDGGNYISPWLRGGTNYSTTSSGTDAAGLAFDQVTVATTDTDFQYISLGYNTPERRPLTMLGTRTTAGNPIGFQKHGNAGADGQGTPTQGTIYSGSVFNNFTVHAYYRQISGQSDPSICDVYILLGQSDWNSSFGTINSYSNPSTDSNGAFFYSSGANTRNLLAISTLLSKGSGVAVDLQNIQGGRGSIAQI